MLKVLVLQHIEFERLGRLAQALQRELWTVDVRLAPKGDALPASMDGYDGLILLGGDQSVNDPALWIAQEAALIQDARSRNLPVAGFCLGSQLIAKAFGAVVEKMPEPEIGWYPIGLTAEGKSDGVTGRLPEVCPMFHWHGESWSLPEGAALLAGSERCPHQIFRIGENIYGFQCHPEVNQEDIIAWLHGYRMEMDNHPGIVESIQFGLNYWGAFLGPSQPMLDQLVRRMTTTTPRMALAAASHPA